MLAAWLNATCGISMRALTEKLRCDIEKNLNTVISIAFRPNQTTQTGEFRDVGEAIDDLTGRLLPEGLTTRQREAFGVLVKMFAREHFIFALLEGAHEGQERIVELSYDRPLRLYSEAESPGTKRRRNQIRENLRRYKVFEFPAMSMTYARSYHWQFLLPEGVAWRAAGLYDMTSGRRERRIAGESVNSGKRVEDEKLIVPSVNRDETDPVFIRMASRVDLHATTREESYENSYARWSALGRARLSLVPSRGTWVGASLAIACMSVLVLAAVTAALFGGLWSDAGNYPSGVLSTVLIFVTVAIPPVLRPESGFAKRVLAGARLAAFSGALPPLLLAITINLTDPGKLSAIVSTALLIMAFGLAFYLYLVWRRANPISPPKGMAEELERGVRYRQYPVKNTKYYEQFDIADSGPEGIAQTIHDTLSKLRDSEGDR
ncbi:hypothetical protein [Streptomyces canus]